jgi:hypothetical protein
MDLFLPDRYEFLVGDRENIAVHHGHNTVYVVATSDIGFTEKIP